ncbi:winged helix-turn-helix transcriptional regulator [Acidisarcina polymorpha]|uniref:winged helix-turn-helix transcriptional regulator n=1 Tax=Acidisarcina polymorpha TaxID=2211140 RepID=UPI000DEEEFCD
MAVALATDAETIVRVLAILHRKWTVHILCRVIADPVRLGQLRRAIPTASKKGLTASLRLLEEADIISRRDLSDSRLHVEYELNEAIRKPLTELLNCLVGASVVLACSDDRRPIQRGPTSGGF